MNPSGHLRLSAHPQLIGRFDLDPIRRIGLLELIQVRQWQRQPVVPLLGLEVTGDRSWI